MERLTAKRAKLGDAFMANVSVGFGSGIGMVPSEESLALVANNDAVIMCVVVSAAAVFVVSAN